MRPTRRARSADAGRDEVSRGDLSVWFRDVLSPNILHHVSNVAIQRVGDAGKRRETRVRESPLYLAEIGNVNGRHVGEVYLADAQIGAQCADARADHPRNVGVYFGHSPCLQAVGVSHYSSCASRV